MTIAIIYKVQLLIGFTKTKSNMTPNTIYFHLGTRMSTNCRCQIGLGQHKFNTKMQELGLSKVSHKIKPSLPLSKMAKLALSQNNMFEIWGLKNDQ
jgi:hypothetical protein